MLLVNVYICTKQYVLKINTFFKPFMVYNLNVLQLFVWCMDRDLCYTKPSCTVNAVSILHDELALWSRLSSWYVLPYLSFAHESIGQYNTILLELKLVKCKELKIIVKWCVGQTVLISGCIHSTAFLKAELASKGEFTIPLFEWQFIIAQTKISRHCWAKRLSLLSYLTLLFKTERKVWCEHWEFNRN